MERSRVSQLPEEVRSELDHRLIGSGFSGYRDLAAWLQDQGFELSHAAVHRHGQKLERQIHKVRTATEQAKALVNATESEGEMSEAVLRVVQSRMFDVFMAAESDDLKEMGTAATALAKVSRADIAVRADRRKVLAEKKAAVQDSLDAAERDAAAGSDPMDLVRRVREEIYGIFDA